MSIPLWVVWAVVVAAALNAVLARDAERRRVRDPGRWAVAAVALVVAVGLSVGRAGAPDEEELHDAADDAAAALDGGYGLVSTELLRVGVEDRLGHDVEVVAVDAGPDEEDTTEFFEVRLADEDSSPTMCFEVYENDSLDGAAGPRTVILHSGECLD